MMIITVFGGSGGIGKLLLKQALDKGYQVKAYVRNPDKITFSHPNLELIKGELYNFQAIKYAISGSDAVVSTLGSPVKYSYEGYPILEGHKNIINAMKDENVTRFITLATPSVKFKKDKASVTTILPGIIARIVLPRAYKEIVQIGNLVASSGLDWTVVRILAPKNTPATGRVNVSFGDKKIKFAISREDIAAFMLKQVKDLNYTHSMPIISS
jgi:putative NADH-flavin reductase